MTRLEREREQILKEKASLRNLKRLILAHASMLDVFLYVEQMIKQQEREQK